MLLYHATNALVDSSFLDFPKLSKAINDVLPSFYLGNDVNVVKNYGRTIVVYELSNEVYESIAFTVRAIDRRHEDGLATYAECAQGGMEWVISTQADLDILVLDATDIYTL